jgi:hypothetical protein
MIGGLRRSLADLACRALLATLPASLQSWGWAIRHETTEIADDTKALLFALDSLCGLLPRAVASRLLHPFGSLIGDYAFCSGRSLTMGVYDDLMQRPRALGITSAIGAVTLGLAYMAIAGAPVRYLAVNTGALVIGLTLLALLGRIIPAGLRWVSGAILTMASVMLTTAIAGDSVDGMTRWVSVGGLAIQPSLILLPVMLVAFARYRNMLTTAGIIATAAAMAIQPDRSMAGILAVGLAVFAVMRPDRHVFAAFAASIVGFAVTLVRTDTLPAAPYVDQILYSSFEVHLGAGAAVLGGSTLLFVPAIMGWRRDPANRDAYAAFGAVWLTGLVAAALGNYPTPIVGYGGSAIIGYALSLLALPKLASAQAKVTIQPSAKAQTPPIDRHLLVGLA